MTTSPQLSDVQAAGTLIPRETPAVSPAATPDASDPAFPNAGSEPVLDTDDIQGNLLVGFNKDHEMLLFLKIDDSSAAKLWLKEALRPLVASATEVLAFNRLFKAARRRRSFEGTVKATWINWAISAAGLSMLRPDADDFADAAFQQGLAASSAALNDPVGDQQGAPSTWLVGGPGNEAHIVLIVASDDQYDLYATVQHIEDSIYSHRVNGLFSKSGVNVIFKQRGQTQQGALAGHEHFGWLDGVSQPGLRGRLSVNENDLLAPRQNTADANQGKPGQDVLWPGEFIFGYPRQNPTDLTAEGPIALQPDSGRIAPTWAKNGSYLVFRRLNQDVGAFHRFLHDTASQSGCTPDALGSRLVGRWPSGAPVLRSPNEDNAALGREDCANNHFEFQGKSDSSQGTAGGSQCNDEGFLDSPGDPAGQVCPLSAHIRKTYPRDDKVDPGQPSPYASAEPTRGSLTEADTQTHRLLRRGIPFGRSSTSHPNAPLADRETDDRGLLFMAYMTSIVDQFEFVTKSWVNDANFRQSGVGIDPMLGQTPGAGSRTISTVFPAGSSTPALPNVDNWVTPTGGGYFFAPPISALDGPLTEASAAAR